MQNQQEIELFISEDGELKFHIKGTKGPGCLRVLDSFAKDIGTVKDKQLTGEYYEKPQTELNSDTNVKHD
jgi:hypothetical protein